MDVLAEILTWSKSRPDWQRDALRRLVIDHELEESDIEALTEICKSAHGLAEQQAAVPFAKEHLPASAASTARVNIQSIYHKCGVNALAENQTLTFGPGLTVVYGDNGAGKSGYTRIFKSACRARGAEHILGNVLSGAAPRTPEVSISYTVGDGPTKQWPSGGLEDSIGRVSVFDRHCEAVYTTQKTDVAFRPFGLDLFDKLSKACVAVRTRLEREQRSWNSSLIQTLVLPENTAAAKFLARLSSLTKSDQVKALGTLSDDEKERLALIEKQLLDLQANDPAKTLRELKLRAGRLKTLAEHLRKLDAELSEQSAKDVFDAQHLTRLRQDEASQLRQRTFPDNLLTGTGSDSWAQMWEAARHFSEHDAYPKRPFPVTEDARCVLCQQELAQDATTRLRYFEAFVVSPAEKDFRTAKATYSKLRKSLDDLQVSDSSTQDAIKELRIESDSLADEAETNLSLALGGHPKPAIGGHLKTGQRDS